MVQKTKSTIFELVRCSRHLPRGKYLRQLASGLLLGKVGYAAAAVAPVRLDEGDPPAPSSCKSTQVAINNAARSIMGKRLSDRTPVAKLLAGSGLPSYNQLAIRGVAIETWKAYHSMDGPGDSRNPLGKLLFGETRGDSNLMITRAALSGSIPPPLPMAAPSLAYYGYRIWNACPKLREARSLAQAKKAACEISDSAPL